MSGAVHVINPNSLETVTDSIRTAVEAAHGLNVPCTYVTMRDGPLGITTQFQADSAAALVAAHVQKNAASASAFVIACFSDPGVFASRELTQKPVIGIGHAGLLGALAFGRRVGVIAITQSSIPRHWRYWRALQLDSHVVNERALDLPVAQSGDASVALNKMVFVGRELLEADGADVLLLGCAGMASLRRPLQEALGVPVIDPCQAAAYSLRSHLAA